MQVVGFVFNNDAYIAVQYDWLEHPMLVQMQLYTLNFVESSVGWDTFVSNISQEIVRKVENVFLNNPSDMLQMDDEYDEMVRRIREIFDNKEYLENKYANYEWMQAELATVLHTEEELYDLIHNYLWVDYRMSIEDIANQVIGDLE